MAERLVSIKDVSVIYGGRAGQKSVIALDGVSAELMAGEVLAVVGASGSGKSTLARVVLGLLKPNQGSVSLRQRPWPPRSRFERAQIQGVFQDIFEAFDPRMTVLETLAQGVLSQRLVSRRKDVPAFFEPLLRRVGLNAGFFARSARSLSGGERQRLAMARALSLSPDVLILDEPVSALDASLRRGAMGLIRDLVRERNLAVMLITHDLDVLRFLATRYMVLLAGRVVEQGPVHQGAFQPKHPWTRLLAAADAGESVNSDLENRSLPCPFVSCPRRFERCEREQPLLRKVADDVWVACHDPEAPPLTESAIE